MSDDRLYGLATLYPRPLAAGESFGFAAVQDLHALKASAPITEIDDGGTRLFTA